MRWSFLATSLALLVMLASCSTGPRHQYSAVNDPNSPWELVFEDEFSGFGKPNPDKWIIQEYNRRSNRNGPDGWWLRDNVELDGFGNLQIWSTIIENRNPEQDDDPFDLASGMVSTEGKFEQAYGRYEARIKLPSSPGWWLAFWLFTDGVHSEENEGRDGTEIDIVEAFGWTDEISYALHWDSYEEKHQSVGKRQVIRGIRRGWHTFALEWTEDGYTWFVDGNKTWESDAGGVSRVPSWVKLSSEISYDTPANSAYWSNAVDLRELPDSFKVDWVRVYRQRGTAPPDS